MPPKTELVSVSKGSVGQIGMSERKPLVLSRNDGIKALYKGVYTTNQPHLRRKCIQGHKAISR